MGRTGGGAVGAWLTAVGVGCLAAAPSGWGYIAARQLRRRPTELAGARAVLEALRTEIAYAATPLPQALRSAARVGGGPAVELCLRAAGGLDGGGGAAVRDVWDEALAVVDARSAWMPSDVVALRGLGSALGASDADDQVRHIALCVGRLRAAEAEAVAQAATQARMWLYLGVLAGLALALAAL